MTNELIEAELNYKNLNEAKDDVLAHSMAEIEQQHTEKLSENRLERMARTTESWKSYRNGLNEARQKHLEATRRHEALKNTQEVLRSVLSAEKQKVF